MAIRRTRLEWWNTAPGLAALIAAGIAIRLAIAPMIGFRVDLDLFRFWSTRLADVGPSAFYEPGVFADYPPGYLYVLWLLGTLTSSPGYVLLKLPAIVGDVALAWTAATLAARLHPDGVRGLPIRPLVLAAVLLNPAVIALSAAWGQVDVIPAALVVSALLLLVTGTPTLARHVGAFACFGAAVAIKPQSGFVFPVLAYALYRGYLHRRVGTAFTAGIARVAAIGGVSLGVWAASGLAFGLGPVALVRFYAESSSVYDVTSVWAFNLWGVIGFWRDDGGGELLVGAACFLAGTAFIIWRSHRWIEHGAPEAAVLCGAAAGTSALSFAVLTRMHERYLFTTLALLAPVLAWHWLRRAFVALSVLFLLNLWYPFAYFNSQQDTPTLRAEPLFGWVFGPMLTTDTWQKKLLSLAVVATAGLVAWHTIDRRPATAAAPRRRPPPPAEHAPVEPIEVGSFARWVPLAVVAGACLVNLVVLRGETRSAPNLNDSALHLQMVRWAAQHLDEGRIALDGWFPFLSLGSSQFHHYQSLPHTLTALVAQLLRADPTSTYLWLQYLLLALWPIAVFAGARLLGWSRWVASAAAVLAPIVVSAPGYGIEHASYVWQGYGVYSQLWGMWLLPLSLGWCWRAITTGRGYAAAMASTALLIASHFLTAYLALVLIGVFGLVAWRQLRARLARTAVVLGGALLTASWVLIPLLADREWSSQSEFYEDTVFRDSFGARRVLGWLASGELFDAGRLPVVTMFAAVGLAICARHARSSEQARAALVATGFSLVLFFGRPTLGPLLYQLPGSGDLQVHRFIIGVHLMGLVLAGVGVVAAVAAGSRLLARVASPPVPSAVTVALVALALVPSLAAQAAYDGRGARFIRDQRAFERVDGADLRALIAEIRTRGDGRVYAGLRSNWGQDYRVGSVPVFAQLANEDVDAIGFTFRTIASLSTDIEARFDETSLAQHEILNVRYLLLPQGRSPSVPAALIDQRGRHRLFEVETSGYFQVVDRVGAIRADRTDLASANEGFLASRLALQDSYFGIAFGDRAAPPATSPAAVATSPGRVESQLPLPIHGRYAATVYARRRAVVLLKVTYDPRWEVTVDGVEAEVVMMSPSLVGVDVAPGRHRVAFRYRPFSSYPLLLTLGATVLVLAALAPRRLQRRATSRTPGP